MNHIEEMMKAVGIFPKRIFACKTSGPNKKCTCFEDVLPPFTPEKQLEIEILIQKADFIDFIKKYLNEISEKFVFEAHTICEMSCETPTIYIVSNKDYAQALAQLTTELIKANELDKREVKRILEK